MIETRQAGVDDAAELMRLRVVMFAGAAGVAPRPGPWIDAGVDVLRRQLTAPQGSVAAYVVDRPGSPGQLAACAVGAVEERLPGPDGVGPLRGYVYSVATDADQRRRGYSRACLEALLRWFAARGVTVVDLRASPAGEPLYASLGFVRTPDPAMRLRLPRS